MRSPVAVLCDFDGTIAVQDVGNRLFQTFSDGSWREHVTAWQHGEISSRECLTRECAATRVSPAVLEEFARSQRLEPTFRLLHDYCGRAGLPLAVVSDGLDFYITRLMQSQGYTRVPVYANRLTFQGDRLVPEFPWHHYGCGKCGNCKRHHVQQYQATGHTVVYIGDGFSDRCAAQTADILFAKQALAQFCQQNKTAYQPYNAFDEVADFLTHNHQTPVLHNFRE